MTVRDEAALDGDDFDRRLSRLVMATADESDAGIDRAVQDVLCLVREHLQMDVAFVSHFEGGRRVFRNVDQNVVPALIAVGDSHPLEESLCQHIIDGRLPELVRDLSKVPTSAGLPTLPVRLGAHLNTTVVLRDGTVYGTLCCFSFAPNENLAERDLKRLRMAAGMVARLIDKSNESASRAGP
ncbi:MAG: GAF domain-containing protein [Variovorax sp.]|nr:MAG: GAF domain-containing protein [Variovorax sp.]